MSTNDPSAHINLKNWSSTNNGLMVDNIIIVLL